MSELQNDLENTPDIPQNEEDLWKELTAPQNELETTPDIPQNEKDLWNELNAPQEEVPQNTKSEYNLKDDVTAGFKAYVDYRMQIVHGARRAISLPLTKMVEDGLRNIGIDIGDNNSKNLDIISKKIDKYKKEHPDQLIHPDTVGRLASQVAIPLSKLKVVGVVAVEAVLNALDGIGQDGNYESVPTDAFIGGALGGVGVGVAGAIGGISNKIIKETQDKIGPLSKEAQYLVDWHPDFDTKTAVEMLKGVPRDDQAYALNNRIEEYADFINKAVRPATKDKLKLHDQLKSRHRLVAGTLGDIDMQVDKAGKKFEEMKNYVALNFPDEARFDSMIPKLEGLVKRYDQTPSKALTIIKNMKADLELSKGTMNSSAALQFRKDLNYLLNKTKRFEEKALLRDMKGGISKFLQETLDTPTLGKVDDAINSYSRAMNNRDFMEIVENHTERKITDWVGLKKTLKKEKQNTPEVNKALEIVEEFSKKFKSDKDLRKAVVVTGQEQDAGGVFTTASYALSIMKDLFFIFGRRHEELQVQKSLLKSIRNADTIGDISKQMDDNGVPDVIKKGVNKAFSIEPK